MIILEYDFFYKILQKCGVHYQTEQRRISFQSLSVDFIVMSWQLLPRMEGYDFKLNEILTETMFTFSKSVMSCINVIE